MALNVTTAAIAAGANTAIAQPSLAQWDQGQILKIEGVELPQSYQVEFSGGGTVRTVPMIGTAEGVQIPNKLLQSSHPITAHVVLHESATDRETEYWITIYVKPRQAPETVDIDPEDISIIDQTIAAAQQAVATSTAQAEAAAGSAEDAAASAEAAEASAQAAAGSASAAASSASAAAGSATAAASAQTVAETAQGAAETAQAAAEQAVTDAQAAGSQAVEAIDEAKTAGIQAIDSEAATQINQVGRAGATQIRQINELASNQMRSIDTKTARSIESIEDARDAAIEDVQAEGQTQTAAAQEQAQAAAGSASAAANSASAAAGSASAAATARTGAETAAASVSASAAQIAQNTEDITDLNRQISEISESYDNLYSVNLVQIGKNWYGGSSANRAVAYISVNPSTIYYISVPTNSNISAVQALEKAQSTPGSSILHSTTVNGGSSVTITTTADTNCFCLQFDGTTDLTASDFENYNVYVVEGNEKKLTAFDKTARSELEEQKRGWPTLAAVAEAEKTGLVRVGGYEIRNIVERPYASTTTQNAHAEPYYDVNSIVGKYSTVNYNRVSKYKNILNNLPSEEIDFTPAENGFTRIVVGKNSDDLFFTAYVASNRLGQFGNPKLDSLEVTSDFVNFTTVLKGCEPANAELVNPSDWQIGKNWIGSAAADRAVIYVPVTAGQTYDVYVPVVDWANSASIIQKSGNQGGSPNKGTTTISNGIVNAVEAKEEVTYFCYQINGNRTITAEDIASYALSISFHDTRGGIVVPNMTNIKVASIKQFSDGTYIVAIRCKDVRDNSNYTHFYRMTGNMLGITHCKYTNFNGESVDMTDEFGGDVYDWHIFIAGNKALATTYGSRNPETDYGRVWYTENCGYSWKQVFQTNNHLQEGQEPGTTVTKAHTHGVMIDVVDSAITRLFVLVGEDNSNIFWTDKGMNATDNDWNVIDIRNQPFYNFQTFTQVVNGYPFKDGLVFGSDNEGIGCIYRINKLDGGGYSRLEPAHEFLPNYYPGTTYCAAEMSRRDESSPLLMCETHESAMFTEADNETLNQQHKARIAATYDGINWMEIWSDDTYGAHDAYIDGQTVSRNYSYCTRGMGAWLLKNGNIVIKYSGRDYYYFGGNPMFSVQGISNGCCKVKVIKGAEKFL